MNKQLQAPKPMHNDVFVKEKFPFLQPCLLMSKETYSISVLFSFVGTRLDDKCVGRN